ncbi:hypothetical protein SCP_0302910 [Sparassis crispa]|uniref:Uncharacterized protein n=1 Tax=Sparassis crispa TaxID=139825 RepID=A0A401GEH0_9APHY|nr:hypothetical protein SCP_0302910 [Sparassis crispa]GBE80576.1 hypothetical protein SCP_0302910 [Sparassis crispa]
MVGVELAERVITDVANWTIVTGINANTIYKLYEAHNPSTAAQIKGGQDALRDALDILHRALSEGLPIPEEDTYILTSKHEILLLRGDQLEKSVAAKFRFNLHEIFVQPIVLNQEARAFNAQSRKLLCATQRSSSIARFKVIKGTLRGRKFSKSDTLTTWSMVLSPPAKVAGPSETSSENNNGESSITLVDSSNDGVTNESRPVASLIEILEFNPWQQDGESGSSEVASQSKT